MRNQFQKGKYLLRFMNTEEFGKAWVIFKQSEGEFVGFILPVFTADKVLAVFRHSEEKAAAVAKRANELLNLLYENNNVAIVEEKLVKIYNNLLVSGAMKGRSFNHLSDFTSFALWAEHNPKFTQPVQPPAEDLFQFLGRNAKPTVVIDDKEKPTKTPEPPQEPVQEQVKKLQATQKNTVSTEQVEEILNASKVDATTLGDKTTVVMVTLPNGFTITESSSCVDPVNYNFELGKKICLERIKNKIWLLEGYVLQQRLYENKEESNQK